MDVYHKILQKLYEETGGKNSQIVDFKNLVKKEGFNGTYPEIFKFLSEQSWIVESSKPDFVQITHWGVKEVKNFQSGVDKSTKLLKDETKKLMSTAKEFLIILDEFASNYSADDFSQVEKKFIEIKSAIDRLKFHIK